MNTMVLLLLSSLLLLLGVTAAEQPMVFGRSVARKRSSRLNRIQRAREAKAPRILIEDGFRTEYTANDALSMPPSFEFSMLGSMPFFEGSSMPFFEGSSMPLSREFSMLISDLWTAPPTSPPSSTDTDVVLAEYFRGAIFEYLGNCAGLQLATDTCLVTKTINNFMSIRTTNEGARLLQTSSGTDDECSHPEVPEQALRAFMSVAKEQCTESGSDVTDEEFDEVVGTFIQLFANEECWVSLCAGVPSSVSGEETSLITSQDARKHLTATSLIVAAGSSVAIAMLIFYVRKNMREEAAQDILGQKYIDESGDGESTHTADLTCATAGDRTLLPTKRFVWQSFILSVDLDTLSEEQSVDCSTSEGGSLVYSITSGENGD